LIARTVKVPQTLALAILNAVISFVNRVALGRRTQCFVRRFAAIDSEDQKPQDVRSESSFFKMPAGSMDMDRAAKNNHRSAPKRKNPSGILVGDIVKGAAHDSTKLRIPGTLFATTGEAPSAEDLPNRPA
jgi:hypothetical protein